MTRVHNLLTLLAIIPFVTPKCTLEDSQTLFRRSVYEFSADLLKRIAEDTESHFVSSTISPYTLLSAVSLGAAEETLKELNQVLYFKVHPCYLSKYLTLASRTLSSDDGATLERSGVVFVDQAIGLKEDFRRKLTATRVCEITPLSFDDYTAAAFQINDFVKSATHGIIDEIVTPNDILDVYMMMIDALYFKGSWRTAFDVENTQRHMFYDAYGSQTGEVNLMFVSDDFNITTLAPIRSTVLELPYGHSNKFSMLIFLPDEGVTVSYVIDNLKKISLNSVFSEFRRRDPQTVSVQLPRFKISSDLTNLKEFMIDMGLKEMFDPNLAKFPYISDYQVYVSSFIQKADIEVTEEGTVAAAVTDLSISFRSSMSNDEFIAIRPFLYMVVDREAEIAVFSGAYSKPSLY